MIDSKQAQSYSEPEWVKKGAMQIGNELRSRAESGWMGSAIGKSRDPSQKSRLLDYACGPGQHSLVQTFQMKQGNKLLIMIRQLNHTLTRSAVSTSPAA